MKSYQADHQKAAETEIDVRDVRALTTEMTVMQHIGAAAGDDALFLVVSSSGSEYLVDTLAASCTCPDHARRGVVCKHQRAVHFQTGMRPIPASFPVDEIVDQLLEARHVNGAPRFVRPSGPAAAIATDGGRDRPDDCECRGPDDRLVCWPCFRDGRGR